MPQINRIRVNNVKYNFGTQYYDDFMMSFSCKNTIYDLANGGGKSVLLLLLLQNLIPNCTLDEKQPVEKLFRTEGGSSVIHSLVEWKLDACYQTDGYQYMTTGFCARKSRDSGGEAGKDTAGIEYFNYCIFYKNFGDNDIRNLPLSADGERITYNGLKAYLRNLDKNDLSVSAYIFERKGDYQNFIAGYGLFESHWEIVRGINKTEGHVRTYFETNYRTARKVIEDLLIEEIIQRSYHSRIGEADRENDMAKTLVDIKDKLAELARKKEQISSYDKQIMALNGFSERIQGFSDIMEEKAALMGQMSDYLIKCRKLILDTEALLAEQGGQRDAAEAELTQQKRKLATARVMEEQRNLDKLNVAAAECKTALDELYARQKAKQEQLTRAEAAGDYQEYIEQNARREEMLVTIENSLRDKQEVVTELYSLASAKKRFHDKKTEELTTRKNELEAGCRQLQDVSEERAGKRREADIMAAVFDSNIYTYEKRLEDARGQLAQILSECGILVEQELTERMEFEQENLAAIEEKQKADEKRRAEAARLMNEAKEKEFSARVNLQILEEAALEDEKKAAHYEEIAQRLSKLSEIYKESEPRQLIKMAYQTYRNQLKATTGLTEKIRQMQNYLENLKTGKPVFDGVFYRDVERYLQENYSGDVISGSEWYNGLASHIKRDIIKRVPFVEYGFVIKGDFERIRQDEKIKNFLNCSYVVPIISENIQYSTKLGVDAENIVFGMQDLNFLKEEGQLALVISRTEEELENLEEQRERFEDRLAVIEEDYVFVSEHAVSNRENISTLTAFKSEREEERCRLSEAARGASKTIAEQKDIIGRLDGDLNAAMENERLVVERIGVLQRALDKKEEADTLLKEVEALKAESAKSHQELRVREEECRRSEEEAENAKRECRRMEALCIKEENFWSENYGAYYKPEGTPPQTDYTEEQLDARFLGLRSVAESSSADVGDKKLLVKSYESAMEKCRHAIEYRGFEFGEIEASHKAGTLIVVDREELILMKQELKELNTECEKRAEEYGARSAQINRVEGSISHAIRQLQENYGSYEPFECPDIRDFLGTQENAIKKMSLDIKNLEKKIGESDSRLNGYRLMERDILRITRDAGIVMPEEMVYDGVVSKEDIQDYEGVEKQFKTLNKNEYRKREEFLKERQKLCDTLKLLDAHDLAEEAGRSLQAPQTVEDVRQMRQSIAEINRCIELERDSVTAGIQDMERIKDSFENRCIQTCINIRAELDRLPQLSRITMDDEVISIIGLTIPYVKEEFYKERMSSYINDTIVFAETFKSMEEKMKYIRGRLAWKKLFSVIVTDMNQVRINLYKRERIRSQSRYLRYEEAVGSTGQSQGIYIQFLIAIINYIASINAAGREASVMGKTIFIDNPFGAAKDVYIWEPIFKMLKTNHVQLIVPARGATPAITGRFDVNYILGQKMAGNVQQTVVVDYASRLKGEELEYTKLSYEQVTLFDESSLNVP